MKRTKQELFNLSTQLSIYSASHELLKFIIYIYDQHFFIYTYL